MVDHDLQIAKREKILTERGIAEVDSAPPRETGSATSPDA